MSEQERRRPDKGNKDKAPSSSKRRPKPEVSQSLLSSTPSDEETSLLVEAAQSVSREPPPIPPTSTSSPSMTTRTQERKSAKSHLPARETEQSSSSEQQKKSSLSKVKERLTLVSPKKPPLPPHPSAPITSAPGSQPSASRKSITRERVSQAVSRTVDALASPLHQRKTKSPTKVDHRTQTKGAGTVDILTAAEKAARRVHLLPAKKPPQKREIIREYQPRPRPSKSSELMGVEDDATQTDFPGPLRCELPEPDDFSVATQSTDVDMYSLASRRTSAADLMKFETVQAAGSRTSVSQAGTPSPVAPTCTAQLDSSREKGAGPLVGPSTVAAPNTTQLVDVSTEEGARISTRSEVSAPILPEEGTRTSFGSGVENPAAFIAPVPEEPASEEDTRSSVGSSSVAAAVASLELALEDTNSRNSVNNEPNLERPS